MQNGNGFFALKELYTKQNKIFEAERRALNKLNTHQNLVPLLASFLHRNTYYFLFPWADGGNLEAFWKQNEKPITKETTLWVAEQCRGISDGLNQIHNSRPLDSVNDDDEKNFGRHGDIKPQNILIFPSENLSYGVLKISDFGLTIFHGARSRSIDRHDQHPNGLTYTAPEVHAEGNISPRYDIWGLGCTYLELITWLLKGHEGITKLNILRFAERGTNEKFQTDLFFKFVGKDQEPIVKNAVRDVSWEPVYRILLCIKLTFKSGSRRYKCSKSAATSCVRPCSTYMNACSCVQTKIEQNAMKSAGDLQKCLKDVRRTLHIYFKKRRR
jgi:serine/threonine protein kinase